MGRSRDNLTAVAEGIDDTGFLVTGLEKGELYIISIIAQNIIGKSGRSNVVEAVPMTFPSAPMDLSFNWTEQGLRIRWKGPVDDGGGDIWYFHIYRGNDPANMTLVKSLGGSFFSYLDTEVNEGGTYYYRVSCENSLGRSPYSDILTVEPVIEEEDGFDMRLIYIAIGAALIIIVVIIGLLMVRNNRRKDWFIEE
jgi:fibronectin type 3 domain-containing protein